MFAERKLRLRLTVARVASRRFVWGIAAGEGLIIQRLSAYIQILQREALFRAVRYEKHLSLGIEFNRHARGSFRETNCLNCITLRSCKMQALREWNLLAARFVQDVAEILKSELCRCIPRSSSTRHLLKENSTGKRCFSPRIL